MKIKQFESHQDYLKSLIINKEIVGLAVTTVDGGKLGTITGTIIRKSRGHNVVIHAPSNKVGTGNIKHLRAVKIPDNVEIVIKDKKKARAIYKKFVAGMKRRTQETKKKYQTEITRNRRWKKGKPKPGPGYIQIYNDRIERARKRLKNLPKNTTGLGIRRELERASNLKEIERVYLTVDGDLDIRTKYLYFTNQHYELGRMIIRFTPGEIGMRVRACNLDLRCQYNNIPHPWGDGDYSICWGKAIPTISTAFNNGHFSILADVLVDFLTFYNDEFDMFEHFVDDPIPSSTRYVNNFLKTGVHL